MARLRSDADYPDFRRAVLARDNYTCQMPFCNSRLNLVVHHIKPYGKYSTLRTNPDNGITLCNKCHRRIFGKEVRYAAMFLRRVYANKKRK